MISKGANKGKERCPILKALRGGKKKFFPPGDILRLTGLTGKRLMQTISYPVEASAWRQALIQEREKTLEAIPPFSPPKMISEANV